MAYYIYSFTWFRKHWSPFFLRDFVGNYSKLNKHPVLKEIKYIQKELEYKIENNKKYESSEKEMILSTSED